MAILIILGIRTWMGEEAFGAWGWRIPFLLSAVLLGVSIWIRLKLAESPMFQKMKDEGTPSKAPLTEAFGHWSNAKIAILALLGATAGEAVVWYGGQFYALFFLTQTLKVPAGHAQIMIAIALAARHAVLHPVRLAVGQDRPQADHPGRLPARGGDLLPDLPGHHPLRQSGAGSGARASPVTVVADPAECSFQLKLTNTEKYTTSCDIAKSALVGLSVNYDNETAPAGTVASIKVGDTIIPSYEGAGLTGDAAKAKTKAFNEAL